MAYSTGSGDYIALMNAVLTHAIADGWTTTGGNWPISKGVVRGVNWSSYTVNDPDFTALGGANRAMRILRIAIGTSPANATANAAANATSAQAFNFERTFSNWWIFSDPGVGKPDYIHVVAQFSNGVNADCFTHFSFGEIDKHGMTHTGVAYATGSPKRGYQASNSTGFTGNTSSDWNSGMYSRVRTGYTGNINQFFSPTNPFSVNQLVIIVDPTVSPLPSGWPLADTIITGDLIWNILCNDSGSESSIAPSGRTGSNRMHWSTWPQFATPMPFSGAVSLGPLPIWLNRLFSSASQVMYLGTIPGARACGMLNYVAANEVSFGADTWMIFPMLRQTAWAQMQVFNIVSSGQSGYAFKKVI